MEVELKLAASAETVEQARTHPALVALGAGEPRRLILSSTYYDTSSGELRSHGIALRLRRVGNVWCQTVKGAGDAHAGMHRRAEYEWPVASPRIDRRKLATTPWASVFEANAGLLKPLFRTEIVRVEQRLVFADGTRAVACFDQGKVRAGRRQLPLCEIEIELVDGDPCRLYELGLSLAGDLPVSIATATKAQRGYELAWSIAPQPVRARTAELAADMSVQSALAALAAECLGQIGSNAESIAGGHDDEFLHQLRVGVRRFRSLLRLVAPVTGKEAVYALVAELRWLAGVLGPARDWGVFATETLSTVLAQVRDAKLRKDGGRLRYRVTRRRRDCHRAAIAAVASARFTRLMLNAGLFFVALQGLTDAPGAPARDARGFAREMLVKQSQMLRKRGKRLRAAAPPERHRARIAAKKLRYTAEFFTPLFGARRAREYVRTLAKLQGVLGKLNDIATAQRLVDELAPPAATPVNVMQAAGMVRGWTAAAERYEAVAIDKAWKSFTKLKPFWT